MKRKHLILLPAFAAALEEQGIGRPSTYAPTITTIISRRYVSKEQKNLYMQVIVLKEFHHYIICKVHLQKQKKTLLI